MTYQQFKAKAMKFTMAQLRCDVQPNASVMDLIDTVGMNYEKFVLRLQKEADANLSKMAFDGGK